MTWRDLRHEQLEDIRNPHPKKGLTGRDLLARFIGLEDHATNKQSAITLDLYVHALQFGEELKFADDKLSTLFSIVKEVHRISVAEVRATWGHSKSAGLASSTFVVLRRITASDEHFMYRVHGTAGCMAPSCRRRDPTTVTKRR